ncbi:MAG: hypothetical protein MRY74_12485 [Neomegalonema sp.]|nr:hypothetical protein [Neomegalonema sp.]
MRTDAKRSPLTASPSPHVTVGLYAVIGLALLICAIVAACSGPLFSSRERIKVADSDIRRIRLWQPDRPKPATGPWLFAKDAAAAAAIARSAGSAVARTVAKGRPADAAFAPLLVDTIAGRSLLRAAGPGRAYAIGAPAAHCPAIGLALAAATVEKAAEAALSQCIAALETRPRLRSGDRAAASCGCRLLAAGDALLVAPEAFARARSVSVLALDPDSGASAALIAESRRGPADLKASATADAAALKSALAGAQSLALRSAAGPAAQLELRANGAALLRVKSDGAVLEGRWRAEGFRRGRWAGVAALRRADGLRMVMLIGYEPDEQKTRRAALVAAALELF